jgi:hypothetical protein
MKTEFCPSCGNKIEYSFSPPNFCGKCGTSLRGGQPAQASTPVAAQEPTKEEAVPHISRLQYDIDYAGTGSKSIKLGDLANQQPDEESQGNRRRPRSSKKSTPLTKEQALLKSVSECKSVGNSSIDVGGKGEKGG